MDKLRYVGQPLTRVDGLSKARGAFLYTADLEVPGMLTGRVVWTPVPHAEILAVTTAEAEKEPGVVCVVTARDIAGTNRFGPTVPHQPVLVRDGERARFAGDAVALVAATGPGAAARAAGKVLVQYRTLPGVFCPRDALEPGAPLIHGGDSNGCSETNIEMGDVDAGFGAADVVVEETFSLPRQEHAYLETEAALAIPEGGGITLYSPTQDPHYFAGDIAQAVGIPANTLRLVSVAAGGAFGGKDDITLQAWAVLLALKSGRPVRMAFSREESFICSPKRHPMEIRIRLGARRSGELVAMEAEVIADAGAYATRSPVVLAVCLNTLTGPYYIPNLRLRGLAVYTNNPVSGACRGYGQPQSTTARELIMDLLARQLAIPPAELRRRNFLRAGQQPGSRMVTLYNEDREAPGQVLDRALAGAGTVPKPSSPYRLVGRGVACAMPLFDISALPSLGLAGTGCAVQLFTDGSLVVCSGVTECGQGVTTVLTQLAAEVLGISPARIRAVVGDTHLTPKSGPTTASRNTYAVGNALLEAAVALRERLADKAAGMLEADRRDLEFRDDAVWITGSNKKVTMAELARACYYEGINLRQEAWFRSSHAVIGYTWITTVADVEVDVETGDVSILRLVQAHDIGRAINPPAVLGQLHGGAAMAVGWALTEDFITEQGHVQTPDFGRYLIPTYADMPAEMRAILVERHDVRGPYGAKGVGEHAMVTTAAAIVNAVYEATGVMITDLPVTGEKVARLLKASPPTSADLR